MTSATLTPVQEGMLLNAYIYRNDYYPCNDERDAASAVALQDHGYGSYRGDIRMFLIDTGAASDYFTGKRNTHGDMMGIIGHSRAAYRFLKELNRRENLYTGIDAGVHDAAQAHEHTFEAEALMLLGLARLDHDPNGYVEHGATMVRITPQGSSIINRLRASQAM